MAERILILGAAGRLGTAAAEAFRETGWSVAGQVRPGGAARLIDGVEPVEAHALDDETIAAAARGATVVLHALNPLYSEWPRFVLPFMDTAIAAAKASGATLLFPGNVYNYGADMPPVLDETTPMRPTSRKGAIRVQAEDKLREATAEGVRAIILRAGDFFGGSGIGSWFDRILVQYVARGRLIYPGPLNVVHEWAYLPDLAATLPRLCAVREQFEPFTEFGFPGHAVTGNEMMRAVMQAAGRKMRVGKMPWWLLHTLSPVVPTFRELTEMAYLWRVPHRIAGDRLGFALGHVPHIPFEAAVAAALHDLGRAQA